MHDPCPYRREVRIDAKGLRSLLFGRLSIDLTAVEQLINISQTSTIGDIIHYYSLHHAGREYPLRDGLERVMAEIERDGMDILSDFRQGDYALPRIFEVAAAMNRMRSLEVGHTGGSGGGA